MTNPRTPTYAQLSALCAQMAAALELVEQCAQAESDDSAEIVAAEMRLKAASALTAYRTLSPDPVYVEVNAIVRALDHAYSALMVWRGQLMMDDPNLQSCDGRIVDYATRQTAPFLAEIKRARGEG